MLLGGLAAAAIVFRLPLLMNAGALSSDAAVVGLQARHALRGEWSWLLWGTDYQGTLEVAVAAATFALAGARPLTLIAGPLLGYLLVIYFTFDLLARRVGEWRAFVAAMAIVLTPQPLNMVSVWPPRQWCITLVFAGAWLVDRASGRGGWRLWLGAFLAGIAPYVDLFAMTFLAGFAAFAIATAVRGTGAAKRLLPLIGGTAVALILLWLSRRGESRGNVAAMSFDYFADNWRLLGQCLPFLLGYDVYVPGSGLYPDLWSPPGWYRLLQVLGVVAFVGGVLGSALLIPLRRVPADVARLGCFGLVVTASTLAGFLLSGMPADVWSARYLAPIIWVLPVTLVPLVRVLDVRRLAALTTPYLLIAAVGGWMAYGPFVRGVVPVVTARGAADEERAVAAFLSDKGVHHAAAQYWLAYRLTFLFGEDPVVVPLDANEDRYAPYRRGFDAAAVVAYVFHPSEPRAKPQDVEQWLAARGVVYERAEVRGFTVLVAKRSGQ